MICVNAAALAFTFSIGLTGIGVFLSPAVGHQSVFAIALLPVFVILLFGFHTVLAALSNTKRIDGDAASLHSAQLERALDILPERTSTGLTKAEWVWLAGGVAVIALIAFPDPWPSPRDCTRLTEAEVMREANRFLSGKPNLPEVAATQQDGKSVLEVFRVYSSSRLAIFKAPDGKYVYVQIFERCGVHLWVSDSYSEPI